jgi:hypothetical protein
MKRLASPGRDCCPPQLAAGWTAGYRQGIERLYFKRSTLELVDGHGVVSLEAPWFRLARNRARNATARSGRTGTCRTVAQGSWSSAAARASGDEACLVGSHLGADHHPRAILGVRRFPTQIR